MLYDIMALYTNTLLLSQYFFLRTMIFLLFWPSGHFLQNQQQNPIEEDCSMIRKPSPTCIVTDSLPQYEINNNYNNNNIKNNGLNYKAMPSIGNGYVGTVVMSDEIHVSGVFNGKANVIPVGKDQKNWREEKKKEERSTSNGFTEHTHRARIPSTIALNFTLNVEGKRLFALDIKKGVFYQWFDAKDILIEQRFYAHRTMKNMIVNELKIQTKISFTLDISSNRGVESTDINFRSYSNMNESDLSYMAMVGEINETESNTSEKVSVAVVWNKIPKQLQVQANTKTQNFVFLTSIVTSLETDTPFEIAKEYYEKAKVNTMLFEEHVKGWQDIWESGNITISNNNYLAQTISTSFYNILSSVRSDWEFGLSPGSLSASHEYLGHTFWDQDIWMFPPMLMLYSNIARSLLQYRYLRLKEAQNIAKKYHFKGK